MPKTIVNFRTAPEVLDEIERLAAEEGRTVSAYVDRIVCGLAPPIKIAPAPKKKLAGKGNRK